VAGGVALLNSASQAGGLGPDSRDARVVKSVLLNSAEKIPAWDNGQYDDSGVITTTQSLDWSSGAGRMNLDTAYDQYLAGVTDVAGSGGGTIDAVGWDFGQLSGTGNQNDYVFGEELVGGSVFDVTLSWFRNRSGTSDNGFADLDLQIWDASFTTLLATSSSEFNNVEHLHYTVPEDGAYGLRVLYDGQVFGGDVNEDYGLAWWSAPGGDANLDELIDSGDRSVLASNWGSRSGWSGGDFTRDGIVDSNDLSLLSANWGLVGVGNAQSDAWFAAGAADEAVLGGGFTAADPDFRGLPSTVTVPAAAATSKGAFPQPMVAAKTAKRPVTIRVFHRSPRPLGRSRRTQPPDRHVGESGRVWAERR
jgi:hypothetical protein